MSRVLSSLACAGLLGALLSGLSTAARAEDEFRYTVQPGDSAWHITERYLRQRSHWYALLNKKSAAHDPTAPQPFKLGPSTHSPSVWWEHEVLEWLEARAQRRFH